MDSEQAVREYLAEFGNTKETDLLRYIEILDLSKSGGKKLIVRLEKRKQIFRIVHTKIRPPGVYFSVKKYIPIELQKEFIKAYVEKYKADGQARALVEGMGLQGERR